MRVGGQAFYDGARAASDGIVESIPEKAVVVDNTSAAHYGLSADDIRAALDW